MSSVRTIHFNRDYTNFHDSPLPRAKLLHAYRKAHELLCCTAFFLLHSDKSKDIHSMLHASDIYQQKYGLQYLAVFTVINLFHAPDVVYPSEIMDI
jgi:hypothetical protein